MRNVSATPDSELGLKLNTCEIPHVNIDVICGCQLEKSKPHPLPVSRSIPISPISLPAHYDLLRNVSDCAKDFFLFIFFILPWETTARELMSSAFNCVCFQALINS